MTDDLLALRVDELLGALASGEPDPGSGSAAALVVAMSASLLAKAARNSRENWPEGEGLFYPRSELALSHGAGVESETPDAGEAYAGLQEWKPVPPDGELPWSAD